MGLFGRIGRRLLRWFLIVALIPLLFMGYHGYTSARQAVEREVFLHMQAVAISKRNAIDQWLQERVADVRVLSRDPELVEECTRLARLHEHGTGAAVARHLEAFQEQSRAYVYFCLYDTGGTGLACTSDRVQISEDFGHSALLHEALRSDVAMSPIFLHEDIGPALRLAGTVRDQERSPLAVTVLTLALAQTLDPIILDTTGLGRTGQAYLVDRDKVMLTPSRFLHHPHPLTHTMDTEGIRRALQGYSDAALYKGYEGQWVIGAWTYMPEQKWAVIAEMDAAEAFAPLARLRRDTFLVALLTLGAVTIVVAAISRSLSRPIRQLAEASLDVSRGNLDRTVIVRLNDELGALAERFNQMVHSLKEYQRQLVLSERLAAIGELVASVVHEIRNPLSAIKMNLRILQGKSAQDPLMAEHFELARAQTDRLEQMLSDLLDYSKPIALNVRPIAVRTLIESALRDFESERQAHQLSVTSTETKGDTELHVDPERMQQVLLNLLLNARDAVGEGGQVFIAVDERLTEDGRGMVISVSDNGRGIPAENLPRVFEPFFTTRKRGTGLGLSNAKKIVEAHGGRIRVESAVGKGTRVDILLPAKA